MVGRAFVIFIASGILAASLGGCAAPPVPDRAATPPADGAPMPRVGEGQTAHIAPMPAPRDDRRRDSDPKLLIGLTGAQIAELLGRPGFVRRDAPAEVWQYRGSDCVLDVFLYADGASARVQHVELRPRQPARPSSPACFAGLLGRTQPASYSGS